MKCSRCDGSGKIKMFYPNVLDREVKCWVCDGSGIW